MNLQGDNRKELLTKYAPMEFAVCASYKYCNDATNVVVGIGLSLMPAQMAKHTIAPDLTIIYEGGSIGSTAVGRAPWGIDDTVIQVNAECQTDLVTVLGCLAQTGRVDLTYLGAAQIDRYGNVNTTLYGDDYTKPKARVSGSGGGHDLAVGANRVAIIMNHGVDRICEKLDYRTSPGYCEGGTSRWDKWGCSGGGPVAIFTNLAVLKPNPVTRELEIAEIFPFTTIAEVKENTGFDIKPAADCKVTPVPTDEEIRVIREVLDAGGDFTGWTKIAK